MNPKPTGSKDKKSVIQGSLTGVALGGAGGYVFSRALPEVANVIGAMVMVGGTLVDPLIVPTASLENAKSDSRVFFMLSTALAGGIVGHYLATHRSAEEAGSKPVSEIPCTSVNVNDVKRCHFHSRTCP